MSNKVKQRKTSTIEVNPNPDGSAANTLGNARSETDRLFAEATKSFESMSEGDSQEFLERSRQTGGQ
jgi:hypothetical protein